MLLNSGRGTEQCVQFVSKSAFDDAQLGIADRDLVGPVVGDDDRPMRATDAGSSRRALQIVVKVVETVRPSARNADPAFSRQSHLDTLARDEAPRKASDAAKRR